MSVSSTRSRTTGLAGVSSAANPRRPLGATNSGASSIGISAAKSKATTSSTTRVPPTPSGHSLAHIESTPKYNSTLSSAAQVGKAKSRIGTTPGTLSLSSNTAPASTTPYVPATLGSVSKPPDSQSKLKTSKNVFGSAVATPLPAASSFPVVRSYSEIVKSEEALQQQLAKRTQDIAELRAYLTQKETEVQLLAAQVSDAEEKLKETEASWETKSEDIITQHMQQYQHLSNQYQDVLLKTQSFENKLQECGVNPVNLEEFNLSAEAKGALEAEKQFYSTEVENIKSSLKKREAMFIGLIKEINAIKQESEALLAQQEPYESWLVELLDQVGEDSPLALRDLSHTHKTSSSGSDCSICLPDESSLDEYIDDGENLVSEPNYEADDTYSSEAPAYEGDENEGDVNEGVYDSENVPPYSIDVMADKENIVM